MTVYVDNFRCPATVGGLRGRWSHLTANTPAELHAFALLIGLQPVWFQGRCKSGPCPTAGGVCVHFHYDVTDGKRKRAIERGAIPIKLLAFGAIISARRPIYQEQA